MNIERLVEAAKEIDSLSVKQEEKSKRMQELARLCKDASEKDDQVEIRKLQAESRSLNITVIDFGGAVNRLRKALKSRK